jgi:hypothetical protein
VLPKLEQAQIIAVSSLPNGSERMIRDLIIADPSMEWMEIEVPVSLQQNADTMATT